MKDLVERAKSIGFSNAAVMPVSKLVIVPEYRRFCEQNLCGCYDHLPVCPPTCGTVAEMTDAMSVFDKALILQTEVDPCDAPAAKRAHNMLTEQLVPYVPGKILVMGAGPWKTWSCMSAYCVDAQNMANQVNMRCWADDGLWRFFSLILFCDQKDPIAREI